MLTMPRVSDIEALRVLADLDRDLLDQARSLIGYMEAHQSLDKHDRDELYMVERLRLLADEWLRWRLM